MQRISLVMTIGIFMVGCAQMPVQENHQGHQQMKHEFKLEDKCPEQLVLRVGDRLKFSAPENPTTGYQWQIQQPLAHTTSTSTYVADKAPAGMVGVGGTRHMEFIAQSAGQEQISLAYLRAWEKDVAPIKSWQCRLNIQNH